MDQACEFPALMNHQQNEMKDGNYEAVIFDMDGLLIDTETHAKVAWQKAAEFIGESFDDETMHRLIGRHIDDCLDYLGELTGKDLRELEFMEQVDNLYFSNFMRNGIDVKTGVLDLLHKLKVHEVNRAVATSSEKDIAPRKLRLAGIEHYFELIVSGCEVEKSKPAPDIFLLTAERMGVAPERCLVLEDSYTGVQGAHAAGMAPVMIPDMLVKTPEMENLTKGIFESLDEAAPFIFECLGLKP